MLCSYSVLSNFIVNTCIILCYFMLSCISSICIILCVMSSPTECAMSTSGVKISPLVPAEEVPHGRHQDWLMEYAGE